MIRYLSVAALLAVGATVAYAQAVTGKAAIEQRQAAMKSTGEMGKQLTAMNKGEAPFDAAKASAAFTTIAANMAKAKGLFPDDSKTGETWALPAIWEHKAEVAAKFDKAAADATAAAAAAKTEAAFKDEYKKVFSNCGGCHKDYRKKE